MVCVVSAKLQSRYPVKGSSLHSTVG